MQKALVGPSAEELFQTITKRDNLLEPKFSNLLKHINCLQLNPKGHATLDEYQETLVSKHRVNEHGTIIRLLNSIERIDERLAELDTTSADAKLLTSPFQKNTISWSSRFGINLFNLSAEEEGKETRMDDGFLKLVKQAFRVNRDKPVDYHEIKVLFVSIVWAATCNKLIMFTQAKTKKVRDTTVYS